MKKTILNLLAVGFVLQASTSHANSCYVTTEKDDGSSSSLRYLLENTDTAHCTPPSTGSDSDSSYFDNVILFETAEAKFDTDINSITLTTPIEIGKNTASFVIGNWSPAIDDTADIDYSDSYIAMLDAAIDYGRVTIAAGLPTDQMPFVCDTNSSPVYLRHMTIWTNGISYSEFFDDFNPDMACFKDGGDVKIINIPSFQPVPFATHGTVPHP